ncbi:MAG: hypothetical protein DWQ07_12265 [Chloroflexi bacterium]|nr:MAG: hypothetical protein DWQ07_12265 [Chloroflexota bacterium]
MDWTIFGSTLVLFLIREPLAAIAFVLLANGTHLGVGSDRLLAIMAFMFLTVINKINKASQETGG